MSAGPAPDIGIFARVFPPQEPESLAGTIAGLGFTCVQLNLVALGHPTIPDSEQLDAIDLSKIRSAFEHNGVSIWGLSATYNMAHPDPARRQSETASTVNLIHHAAELGATAVSLCTGTRDPENQWRAHPDNNTATAWEDMMSSFEALTAAAEEGGVLLAVEPEPANIISGTDQALRLLDALGASADRVGFILDPANLVAGEPDQPHDAVLQRAFSELGSKAICVHAKDIVTWTERLAGSAGLDYVDILRLHAGLPGRVPIIIQDTQPDEAAPVRDLLLAAASEPEHD